MNQHIWSQLSHALRLAIQEAKKDSQDRFVFKNDDWEFTSTQSKDSEGCLIARCDGEKVHPEHGFGHMIWYDGTIWPAIPQAVRDQLQREGRGGARPTPLMYASEKLETLEQVQKDVNYASVQKLPVEGSESVGEVPVPIETVSNLFERRHAELLSQIWKFLQRIYGRLSQNLRWLFRRN